MINLINKIGECLFFLTSGPTTSKLRSCKHFSIIFCWSLCNQMFSYNSSIEIKLWLIQKNCFLTIIKKCFNQLYADVLPLDFWTLSRSSCRSILISISKTKDEMQYLLINRLIFIRKIINYRGCNVFLWNIE